MAGMPAVYVLTSSDRYRTYDDSVADGGHDLQLRMPVLLWPWTPGAPMVLHDASKTIMRFLRTNDPRTDAEARAQFERLLLSMVPVVDGARSTEERRAQWLRTYEFIRMQLWSVFGAMPAASSFEGSAASLSAPTMRQL